MYNINIMYNKLIIVPLIRVFLFLWCLICIYILNNQKKLINNNVRDKFNDL